MNILDNFLQSEINSKEYFDSIISFINSYEIRRGEFEGNDYVVMKIDRDNFILFPEYDNRNEGGIQIPFSLSIYKERLTEEITKYAEATGII